jgi:GNAT superfamily N-acetyltransferase
MSHSGSHPEIRSAIESDVPEILSLIRSLAEYEKLTHMVQADEARLRETLFGEKPAAEVLLAFDQGECAGFAVFFPTYSTFLARPGLYLEDLFVHPHLRRRGIGLALLKRLARLAIERGCGRLEWEVLDCSTGTSRLSSSIAASGRGRSQN